MDKYIIRKQPKNCDLNESATIEINGNKTKNKMDIETNETTEDSANGEMEINEITQDIDTTDSDSEEDKRCPTSERKVISNRKFRLEWISDHSRWLIEKNNKAFCVSCNKSIAGSKFHIDRHANKGIHINNLNRASNTRKVDMINELPKKKNYDESVKADLKCAMFIAEHNLPFVLMDHLPGFLRNVCHDSEIAKNIQCARTKTTHITKDVIGTFSQNQIGSELQNQFFSLIIDETTDVSVKKCLAILVRYYDEHQEKICDKNLAICELEATDAKTIYSKIMELLERLNIPIQNMIGFASDNASVMQGHLNGVKALLLQQIPNLFVMGCISHSLHLCASKACQKLPKEIEELCKAIYRYFAHSSKRKKEFATFQQFAECQPHTLLRPSQTRWLSLRMVVDRILEQWNALCIYFQGEVYYEDNDDDEDEAREIMNGLQNSVYRLYYFFLNHILTIITDMNKQFQSETSQIHIFHKEVTSKFKLILRIYMKLEIINKLEIHLINPANPDYFLPLNKIFCGGDTESFILEKKNDR